MKKYFLHDGVTQQGPFTFEELRAKNITPKTQVWFDPMPAWKPAGEVDELKSLFNTAANPVASAPATNVDWNNKQFYYMDSAGTRQGPFYLNQLAGKNINANTAVWYEPLPSWTTAGKVDALKNIIGTTTVAHPVASAPVKEEDWKFKQYYYVDSAGVQQGPFHLNQLEGKGITANTAVWYDPLPSWTTAGKVEGLRNIIAGAATVAHPVTSSPAQSEDWNSKQFYYIDSAGTRQGPFHLNQLAGKNITPNTSVWYDPLPSWTTAGKVDALKNIIAGSTTAAQTVAHPVTSSPAQSEDWNNKQYFIADSAGAQQGPFTMEQLKEKNISPGTLIWYSPLPKWTTAGEVAALKDIINTPPPIS